MEIEFIKIIEAHLPPCPSKSNKFQLSLIMLLSIFSISTTKGLIFLPFLSLKSFCLVHIVYYILTLGSNSTSTLIINLCLHLESSRPAYQFIILQTMKLLIEGLETHSTFLLFFLSICLMIISKDSENLFFVRKKFEESYLNKKEISDNLEVPVLFIHENGKIAKCNKKADFLFNVTQKKDFFSLISYEKVERFKEMIRVAKEMKIPEEDSTFLFESVGKFNFWISMKLVPLDDVNCFLITFDNTNFSRKKREFVLESYRKSFVSQVKLKMIFEQRYSKNEKIYIEDCCKLIRYMYTQQETINITEMLTGQPIMNQNFFSFDQEVTNCINLYWEHLECLNITLNLHVQNPLSQVISDILKHHLLIKSLIHIISYFIDPKTTINFHLNQLLNHQDCDLFYTLHFTSTKATLSSLSLLLKMENNTDHLIKIREEYDMTVSLFPWLLNILGGSVHNLQMTGSEVTISFMLKAMLEKSLKIQRPYLFSMKSEKNIISWKPFQLSEPPQKIFRMRPRASAETEVITEEISNSWSEDCFY
jgi:hypothetical protein